MFSNSNDRFVAVGNALNDKLRIFQAAKIWALSTLVLTMELALTLVSTPKFIRTLVSADKLTSGLIIGKAYSSVSFEVLRNMLKEKNGC